MARSLVVPVGLMACGLAILAASAVAPGVFRRGPVDRIEDFGIYWSAARVALDGGDPYDADAVFPYQRGIEPGRTEGKLPWGPPWSLALLYPFAAADFPAARWGWFLFGVGLLLGSAAVVWDVYRGPLAESGWAWALGVLFYPSLLVTALGQQTVFALAGVAGFLWFAGRGRPVLAGACFALTLAKPQNLIPLWVALGVYSAAAREWRYLAGLAAAGAVLTAVAAAPNPGVFAHYVHGLTHNPPSVFPSPTLGTLLRMAVGGGGLGAGLVPLGVGAVWAAWWAWAGRRDWDWADRTPALLFVSYLTTPHGWVYDQVVLLVPVLRAAAGLAPGPRAVYVAGHLGLTALCLVLNWAGAQEYTFVWLVPAVLGLYLVARRDALTSRTGP